MDISSPNMPTKTTSRAPWLSRRQMLQSAGAGMGAVGLASLLADNNALLAATNRTATAQSAGTLAVKSPHFFPRAKRLIYLYMNGGPSQVDTFDYKPLLEKHEGKRPPAANLKTLRKTTVIMKSPWKFRQHGQSGLWVSELFPQVARCIDDICIVRSMRTDVPEHAAAMTMMNIGSLQPNRPSLGSWLGYGLGTENQNLPGYVFLSHRIKPRPREVTWSNSFLPGIYAGVYVDTDNIDPKQALANIRNPYLTQNDQRTQLDLLAKLEATRLKRLQHDAQLEARIQSMELAFRMQLSAPEAFDLGQETQSTLDRYGIQDEPQWDTRGGRQFGGFPEGCLLARRLSERGVRVVQVGFGGDIPWDDHEDIMNHEYRARHCDQAIAALLTDLKARGLLEETLVMWGGEFGRTPVNDISGNTPGRDHNHYGFTVWLAGGGVQGGMTYGTTDDLGFKAVDKPLHVHDLHATILYAMGLDHEKLTYHFSGRDFRLTDVFGKVATGIFA